MTPLSMFLAALALFLVSALLTLKPSRIELKWCSNWTLFPTFQRVTSSHGTKRFWLLHLPWVDCWAHFELPADNRQPSEAQKVELAFIEGAQVGANLTVGDDIRPHWKKSAAYRSVAR